MIINEDELRPVNVLQSPKPLVSIIIPVYYNEGSIRELYRALEQKVFSANASLDFEVIFVDDGSGDKSFDVLMSLREEHSTQLKIIKLTRNFGQVNAILVGQKHCRGDFIVVMSADLQDPPELINEMIPYTTKRDIDVVIATRQGRDESLYRVLTSKLFYWMMKKLTFANMPIGGFDYFMISKRVNSEVLRNFEANPFPQGQILYTGYSTHFLQYRRDKRMSGSSKWSFTKKVKALIDGVMSYSYLPVRIMTIMGILTSLAGFFYALIITIAYFIGNNPFKGWAPIMIIILVLSGIQMLMIGIIGEYLWRTLDQVRGRSQFVIDKIYD